MQTSFLKSEAALDPRMQFGKNVRVHGSRAAKTLAPLIRDAALSSRLLHTPLTDARTGTTLQRFLFIGERSGGDPIRIGLFAGIHGDEPAGVHALIEFGEWLVAHPEAARGYHLFIYPICNPAGFEAGTRHTLSGKDLNREFWKNSSEPEVQLLENEIIEQRFQGLISLHADDTSEGVYGFVRGAVLTKSLLEPALQAAEQFLPRNRNATIDGFPAHDGIISQCYDGILTAPPRLEQTPFEIILETPAHAALDLQIQAFLGAINSVLAEYPKFLSFAADL